MHTLRLFLENCRNFPHVTQKEFNIIQENLTKLLQEIKRSESIPTHLKNAKEKELIQERNLLISLSQLKFKAKSFSFFDTPIQV